MSQCANPAWELSAPQLGDLFTKPAIIIIWLPGLSDDNRLPTESVCRADFLFLRYDICVGQLLRTAHILWDMHPQ